MTRSLLIDLKDFLTAQGIGDLATDVSDIEALLTTTNSLIVTIDSVLDAVLVDTGQIETLITTTNALIVTLSSSVAGIALDVANIRVDVDEMQVDLAATVAVLDNILLGLALKNARSVNNSTTSTLLSGAVFTGTSDSVIDYHTLSIQIDASHDSAVDGIQVQFSIDATNWDDEYLFTYTAADGARHLSIPITARFFRIVYTNGGTNQTHFRLEALLMRRNPGQGPHRLQDDLDPDEAAPVVKAALLAQEDGAGDFVRIQANPNGALRIEKELAVVTGSINATTTVITLGGNSGIRVYGMFISRPHNALGGPDTDVRVEDTAANGIFRANLGVTTDQDSSAGLSWSPHYIRVTNSVRINIGGSNNLKFTIIYEFD
ncbi:MAG: hypothetical protein V3S83_12305 [Gemmatimonadota bacterium]